MEKLKCNSPDCSSLWDESEVLFERFNDGDAGYYFRPVCPICGGPLVPVNICPICYDEAEGEFCKDCITDAVEVIRHQLKIRTDGLTEKEKERFIETVIELV